MISEELNTAQTRFSFDDIELICCKDEHSFSVEPLTR